jgi:hypothetical protein
LGFKPNLKDPCVFNKLVNNTQITVLFHVDDFIATCSDRSQLQILYEQFIDRFGQITHSWGPTYNFLGMEISRLDSNRIGIAMKSFISKLLDSFPTPLVVRSTPVSANIFTISEDSDLLPPDQKELFHSTVASLLYLSGKIRKDISVGVAFLTSRVLKPTSEDWDKLVHLIQYIRSTVDRMLILGGSDSNNVPKLYCDASFGVHPDGKSHSGISIHFNLGAVICKSIKQKVVSKSSAEAELIALSDGAAICSWVLQFLEEQGYPNPTSVIFEDNQAAIALAQRGSATSERTRHIRIRHFFVTQFLESEEMTLHYCETAMMIADLLTKYLGCPQFTLLRDAILGYVRHIKGV